MTLLVLPDPLTGPGHPVGCPSSSTVARPEPVGVTRTE